MKIIWHRLFFAFLGGCLLTVGLILLIHHFVDYLPVPVGMILGMVIGSLSTTLTFDWWSEW